MGQAVDGFWGLLSDPAYDPERNPARNEPTRGPSLPLPSQPHSGPERRDSPRTRTLLKAKIVSGDGFLSPDCAVVDLSLNGARVRISAAIRLPPPVSLLLVYDGMLFDAAVAWRRGDETGLVFTGQHDLRSEICHAAPALKALWAELQPRLWAS
jgi:hypothetical protein